MSTYDCVVIGEGNLTLALIKIIYSSPLSIKAIITHHERIIVWCKQNNILHLNSLDNYSEDLKKIQFDYLICAINEKKLPKDILEQAKICSINYHDSLLPKYSGVHATAWAILNGEQGHGITWHAMNDAIDEGDIILCKTFKIDKDETSLTLNLKCFDAAIKSLPELIKLLINPPLPLKSQNEKGRVFYYRKDKPVNNGVINKDMPLTIINRLINAANFGHVDNDFYSAKIQIGKNFFHVLDAKCFFSKHNNAHGIVVEIKPDYIKVAYKEGYLYIFKIANSTSIYDISTIVEQQKLIQNMPLAHEDLPLPLNYKDLIEENHANEQFLIYCLRENNLANINIDSVNETGNEKQFLALLSAEINLNKNVFVFLICKFISDFMSQAEVLVPVQLWKNLDLSIQNDLFLRYSFVSLNFAKLDSFKDINASIEKQLSKPILIQSDIKWRYKGLTDLIFSLPVLISLEKDFYPNASVIFNFNNNSFKIYISNQIEITKLFKDSIERLFNSIVNYNLKI